MALDPWPLAGGDAAPSGTAEGPDPPYRVAWQTNVGDGQDVPVAPPVVGEDLVVVVTGERVVALDPGDGNAVWEAPRESGTAGPAALGEDLAVFVSGRGEEAELVAVRRDDGEEAWTAGIGGASPGGVTVANGAALVGTRAGEVVAVDLASGDEAWRFEAEGTVEGPPASVADVILATGQDLDPAERRASLHALDPEDGSERWSVPVEDVVGASSAPSGVDALVVFGGGDLRVRAVDPEDGTVRWEVVTRAPFPARTAPAIPGDVVAADTLGHVYRLDPGTGEERWRFRVPGLVLTGSPVVAGEAVLIADESGQVSAIDLDRGVLVWRHTIGEGPMRGVALGDDAVIAASATGDVVAFEHDPDGELLEEPSPTTLFWGRALLNFAGASALIIVLVSGLFVLLRRWRG